MAGSLQASVLFLLLFFASLMLLATTHAFASADTVSNGLQQSPSSSIQITLSKQADTAIRLEARAAPLGQILKAIADKTDANIHYSVLPEAPVTATCVGANVGQVMDCLVAKQVGLVAHKPLKDKPAEFWLLGSSVGSCQAVTVAPSAPLIQTIAKQDYKPSPEEQAQYDKGMKELTELLIGQYRQAKNTQERGDALASLAMGGNPNDPNARKLFEEVAEDKDPNIRSQVLSIMASLKNEDAAADAIGRALHDSDATVRMAALGYVGEDTDMLKQALSDSDTQVRELAAAKLAQINKKRGGGENTGDL